MVTLFYNTAAKFGADTAITDTYKFDKTYDAEKIREYAVTPMKWAMQNSIISGTGVNGKEIIVDPWGTATRAQAAQIITMYLKFTEKDMPAVTGLTINGNPIESYTIVYGAENPCVKNAKDAAEYLKEYISNEDNCIFISAIEGEGIDKINDKIDSIKKIERNIENDEDDDEYY